jgi:hypothetical protein
MKVVFGHLNLVGDSIGFFFLIWKTIYDIYYNPRKFKKEYVSGNYEANIKAVERKRERSDKTTLIAFIGLTISYLCLIINDFLN